MTDKIIVRKSEIEAILQFLDGSQPLNGEWFDGEGKTKFWWRKHIRELQKILDNSQVVNSEPVAKNINRKNHLSTLDYQMTHITLNVDDVEKLYYSLTTSDGERVEVVYVDDLRALIANSPKADDLVKDAERYRYMRNNTSVMTFEKQTWVTSHKLDMRIDEAMKGKR